jgi:outer membrane scaffolding protein for murein synthesis (MipA/OmpV family)
MLAGTASTGAGRVLLLLVATLSASVLLASAARAQTPLPLAEWQYSAGEVLTSLQKPVPEWRATLGAGAFLQPKFEGAKRYDLEPSGVIDIRYRDIAFLSDGEGIGLNLLHGRGYRAGVALSYDLGRDSHDDPRLRNLPNVAPAPEPKLFAQYFLLPVVLTLDVRKAIGGENGFIGDVGAYVPLPVAKRTYLFVGPSLTVASRRYMQSYFGVGGGTAANSGLPAFSAHGGLKNATLGATLVRLIGEHWLILGEAAYERLLGSAADSPIPETRTQFALGLNVAYRF